MRAEITVAVGVGVYRERRTSWGTLRLLADRVGYYS
jgi:hypothetical protein